MCPLILSTGTMNIVGIFVISCTILLGIVESMDKKMDYELLSIEIDDNDENIYQQNTKMNRISLGVFAAFVNFTLLEDFDENFIIDVKVYRSAMGNNQYKLTAFNVNNNTIEDFINGLYKSKLMDSLKDHSNLPQFDGEWKGPLTKGKYYIKDYIYDFNMLKKSNIQAGTYKIIINIFKNDKVICKITIIVRMFEEFF